MDARSPRLPPDKLTCTHVAQLLANAPLDLIELAIPLRGVLRLNRLLQARASRTPSAPRPFHVARRTSDAQLPRVIICLEEIGRTRFTQHQTKVINVVALFSLFAHFVACLW